MTVLLASLLSTAKQRAPWDTQGARTAKQRPRVLVASLLNPQSARPQSGVFLALLVNTLNRLGHASELAGSRLNRVGGYVTYR